MLVITQQVSYQFEAEVEEATDLIMIAQVDTHGGAFGGGPVVERGCASREGHGVRREEVANFRAKTNVFVTS